MTLIDDALIQTARARLNDALDHWLLAGGLAAAAAIVGAHLVERVGGYPPCFLCFVQRWAFWAAIAAAGIGLAAARRAPTQAAWIAMSAMGLAFAAGAAVAAFHAGVEWKFWPGPAFCTSAAGERLDADALSTLFDGPANVVDCSAAPFRIAGLSMAGWNVLYCAGLAALSLMAAGRPRRHASQEPAHV